MTSIQTNLNALFALRQLGIHNTSITRALEKLASGYRINRSADDPSGLALADKLRSQIRGYQQVSKNIGQAINMVRTAEDGMTQVITLLMTAKDAATFATNSTTTASDRLIKQAEVNQLLDEIDRLSTAVRFNALKLLNGTFSTRPPKGGVGAAVFGGRYIGSLVFQAGPFAGDRITTGISTLTVLALGIRDAFARRPPDAQGPQPPRMMLDTKFAADSNLAVINSVLASVLSRRARIGAFETRLEGAKRIADFSAQAHLQAESEIRDADIAAETVEFTKRQILVQVATAMLAQANLLPKTVLQLFQISS